MQFAQVKKNRQALRSGGDFDKNLQKKLKEYDRFEPFFHKTRIYEFGLKNMHKFKKTYSQAQYIVV